MDKKKIISAVRKLDMLGCLRDEGLRCMANELLADIERDFYTIVVLGEFKRGKSTLINALLGKSLLPMDVLPETATINAIMYSEKPVLHVVGQDGRETEGEPTESFLARYSARVKENEADNVRYIKIGYPSELLKNRVVLVDTPGVSDLNEQRCEVTYQFLPHANAVIFLLDATAPLKGTEQEFISKRLLPQGITNILFLANRYDYIDEEEDGDVLENLEQRLKNAFALENHKIPDIHVMPFSAKMALQGVEKDDEQLAAASGLRQLQQKLSVMLSDGRMEQEKISAYRKRCSMLMDRIIGSIETEKCLKRANHQELEEFLQSLHEMLDDKTLHKSAVASYTEAVLEEIQLMADKSLHYFQHNLQRDIMDIIETYQGEGFKDFVEGTLCRRIQRSIEEWISRYSPNLDKLFFALEQELARGLSVYFKRQISLKRSIGKELRFEQIPLQIEAEDISNASMKAGLLTAAGALGLMAIVGGAVMPMISFAAYPFLRQKMIRERLAEAKERLRPLLEAQIAQAVMRLQEEIHRYARERAEVIRQSTERVYEDTLLHFRDEVECILSEKRKGVSLVDKEIQILDEQLEQIGELKESI